MYVGGAWVAQCVNCLPSAQDIILGSWDQAWCPCHVGPSPPVLRGESACPSSFAPQLPSLSQIPKILKEKNAWEVR